MTDDLRGEPMLDELIEECSEAVHQAYCENYLERKGEPYWTGGDYSKLDEETKEIDRATVRAVLAISTRATSALFEEAADELEKCKGETYDCMAKSVVGKTACASCSSGKLITRIRKHLKGV